MTVQHRNNVKVFGNGAKPILFIHGFGCDQNMWRLIAPAFVESHKIILYDLVGFGNSDLAAYDKRKYGTLAGHATDVLEICDALDLTDTILVGHSVGAMIAVLAANRDPSRFSSIVLVAPSPCYINDDAYVGGFSRQDIDGLLELLDNNFLGWSSTMAPIIMGVPDRPELSEELTNSFCRTDPSIARHFARVTFLSDNRSDARALALRALILQCSADAITPGAVGAWLHANIPAGTLVTLQATGHCPQLSAPAETIAAMRNFLA